MEPEPTHWRSSIATSVARVFSLRLLSQVLLGVAGIAMIHGMAMAEYARLTFAASVVTLASQAMSGAFNRVFVVGYREMKLKGSASSYLGLQLISLAGVAAISLPAWPLLGEMYGPVLLMIAARCLADYAQTVFQQDLHFVRYSLVSLLQAAAILSGLLALLTLFGDSLRASHVLLLQATVFAAAFGVNMYRRIVPRQVFDWTRIAEIARAFLRDRHLYLFGYFAVLTAMGQLDFWVLRLRAGDIALATYGSAYRYFALMLLVLNAVHAVLLPHIERVRDLYELDSIFSKHRRMLAVFAPGVVLAGWASQWLIPWIDQGRYPEAVQVFWIFCPTAIVSFALSPYANVLLCAKDYRFLLGEALILLPVHACVCAALTDSLGPRGTAAAVFVSFTLLNGAAYLRARWLRTAISWAGASREGAS